jgi:hypothetical protein
MKKNLLIIICVLLYSTSQLSAQPYGNEWIDYSQQYYKIKVAADGMYRIPFATLSTIPNIGSLSTSSFVMYHNGQTVPIYVSSNSTFGSNDFIEFYGKKNIGDLDTVLYANDSLQPHIYYSLFNDTSIYYLTIKTNGGNPRFTPVTNDLTNPPSPEPYFMFASRQIYTGQNIQGIQYYAGTDQAFKSTFDYGEGYGNAN